MIKTKRPRGRAFTGFTVCSGTGYLPAASILCFFVVTQRNNQHVDVDGVDQLTCGGHQFAPEILVVTTNDQIHVVFFDGINQNLAQVAATAQVSVIG